MEEKEVKSNNGKKLSYSELENVAHQLSEQTKQLYMKLQSVNMNNMFKRLDYLFKVIENGNMFKQDFLERSINEIEELMTIPEEAKEKGTSNIETENKTQDEED